MDLTQLPLYISWFLFIDFPLSSLLGSKNQVWIFSSAASKCFVPASRFHPRFGGISGCNVRNSWDRRMSLPENWWFHRFLCSCGFPTVLILSFFSKSWNSARSTHHTAGFRWCYLFAASKESCLGHFRLPLRACAAVVGLTRCSFMSSFTLFSLLDFHHLRLHSLGCFASCCPFILMDSLIGGLWDSHHLFPLDVTLMLWSTLLFADGLKAVSCSIELTRLFPGCSLCSSAWPSAPYSVAQKWWSSSSSLGQAEYAGFESTTASWSYPRLPYRVCPSLCLRPPSASQNYNRVSAGCGHFVRSHLDLVWYILYCCLLVLRVNQDRAVRNCRDSVLAWSSIHIAGLTVGVDFMQFDLHHLVHLSPRSFQWADLILNFLFQLLEGRRFERLSRECMYSYNRHYLHESPPLTPDWSQNQA